jgi:predicted alpha/beta hydrolase
MKSVVARISFGERAVDASTRASICATFFEPDSAPRAAVLLPAAMGVTQKYYANYAAWLAAQGFLAATFDYRGMGASIPPKVRDSEVAITDWAEGDCAAMIDALKAKLPDRPLFVVGHSLGGQLIGMIPNRRNIDGVVLVGSGSGFWRDTSPPTRRASIVMFYFLSPVMTAIFGYFPGKPLRAVGNLPRGVIGQWRRWCLHPEYLIGVEGESVRANYAAVSKPMFSLSFTDDEMMSARCTETLHRFYAGARIETKRIAPSEIGVRRIGHFGFFRDQFATTLWPLTSKWMEQRS